MIIAIDGPAGSGKSTVSKRVARRLGLLYIDTGAMYRALTLKAVRENIGLRDEKALIDMAQKTEITLYCNKDNDVTVLLDGRDVSDKIRSPELTKKIKFIASIPGVRNEMVRIQRKIAENKRGAVLEGRDIGTVVFPDADKKFYLDADYKERARRRHKELIEAGQSVSLKDIEEDVKTRDKSDMERDVAPLIKAEDAVCIDTTYLTINGVVEKILNYL